MLFEMSNVPPGGGNETENFSTMLSALVEEADQDRFFLSGSAMSIGVLPNDSMKETPRHGCLIVRCLWESHWREEWCGIFENSIAFYAPLTNSACLELSFADIQSVRRLEAGMRTPLPGFPVLVLETAWMCHYLAFGDQEAKDSFKIQLTDALTRSKQPGEAESDLPELRQARFWQGFQNSIKVSLSSGQEKWADIMSGTKSKSRVVLNNRRMAFDLEAETSDPLGLVEDLLSTALSFSLQHLTEHPQTLVRFLDWTSQLRNLDLDELDLSSSSAFCFFVNVYHCLLQHAMLLSVNGPLHKRSFEHFMRSSCYEIGGDVFSLAELQCCIIRGNMSKPIAPKPPFITPPKKSNAYRFYALRYTTPVVNFVLNNGDTKSPRDVPVLTPETLDLVMSVQATEFLRRNLYVDFTRRVIVLPKVCEVYRNDFAMGSADATPIRFCLPFLDEESESAIKSLLEDEASVIVKFQPTPEQYHTTLGLRDFEIETPQEV